MKAFLLFLATSSLAFAQDGAPVDWKTVATEFSQDQAAAEAKYQGKIITVTGPVRVAAQKPTRSTPLSPIAPETVTRPIQGVSSSGS